MIIVKIIGGLGNQMFQYAFFMYLKAHGKKAKLDITDFGSYKIHNGFELDEIFNIISNSDLAAPEEINVVKDNKALFRLRKLSASIISDKSGLFIKPTHWIEPNYSKFYNSVLTLDQHYLDGYWQNDNYLKFQEYKIKDAFIWRSIDDKNKQIALQMRSEESVSIHIRRFDTPKSLGQLLYIIKLRMIWRVASKEYYLKAIDYVQRNIESPVFYIFTDNINWVKRNIPVSIIGVKIIDWNRGEKSHYDMYLMTNCKHNIISMSSFSWWGAWLNPNLQKTVIAPRKWALKFKKDYGIIPENWIRI